MSSLASLGSNGSNGYGATAAGLVGEEDYVVDIDYAGSQDVM
jgi:hypothetical protein